MRLKYEPASEPLHISVKYLFQRLRLADALHEFHRLLPPSCPLCLLLAFAFRRGRGRPLRQRLRSIDPGIQASDGTLLYMVYSLWIMVYCLFYGLWFMVYGLWFMVYGLWFMVYGLWFMVYGSWFMVYGLWFMVYVLWFRV